MGAVFFNLTSVPHRQLDSEQLAWTTTSSPGSQTISQTEINQWFYVNGELSDQLPAYLRDQYLVPYCFINDVNDMVLSKDLKLILAIS